MEGLDPKLVKKLKEKISKELLQKEKETVEYWFKELEALYNKNHQTLAELKSDLRRFLDRMKNRLEIIKTKGI